MSVEPTKIEHMFDSVVNAERRQAAEALESMAAASRQENAAGAARLSAIADLYELRSPEGDVEKLNWVIDGYSGLAAEVAAAQGVSQRRAKAQVELAIALRERLPAVAAVYATGAVDRRLIATVVARTDLVEDPARLTVIDANIAAKVAGWARYSGPQQQKRVDEIIARNDPAGVRAPRPAVEKRRVDIDPGPPGVADIWARARAADAAAFDAALNVLADGVCRRDPRTKAQRRADAIGALAMGRPLACQCGQDNCPAIEVAAAPVNGRFVIHLIADEAGLSGDPHASGLLPDHGLIPAEQITQLVTDGATVKRVKIPPAQAEPGYRPSVALADFVRCRDLTCRFPGCDVPATECDIDHTVPWPAGPTHPSNLKLLCRFHHLLKTFHTGWSDLQLPDGAVVWATPSGNTYTTTPHGAHWFPELGAPTGTPTLGRADPAAGRELKMPTRRRTRAQERTQRIRAERAGNQARIDERKERLCQQRLKSQGEPPF
ncbi:uncharacterized protein RMCC_2055 [Mycolicibacterium canariasense]|uniref:HNH nuclease domain-containing protein n=2 Tax=Mycolicibacterium canariasense TaxID=228230 RepID=A0A117I9P7_MYCCR|nr:uncharacterized protein RMCC_2055 [Mycolicibacterium canariasense]